tara:strand:- start:271 stop:615 length:345 start_codon:yes stop_codon:yes gene_type:complete
MIKIDQSKKGRRCPMNIHWCRSEAERLWWLHRENAMWWDELRASLLVIMASLKADLRRQDPESQEFKQGLNNLKKTRLLWKDVNEAIWWEEYDGVDARRVRVLQQIERLKPEKD